VLAEIATTTGGKERVEIPKIWSELPVRSRYVELAPWLLVLGTVLFLLEILERRTGWVTRLFGRKSAVAQLENEETEAVKATPKLKSVRTAAAPALAKSKVAAPEKQVSMKSTLDDFRKARERADRRTNRER